MGSHVKDTRKTLTTSSMKDINLKRRLPADETVFKIYKGVKTFDFSKIKNVLATGGNVILNTLDIFLVFPHWKS